MMNAQCEANTYQIEQYVGVIVWQVFCSYVHFHASIYIERRSLASGDVRTSDKRTTCHSLLLASCWLEERNWSNYIMRRKKGRLLVTSSNVALVFF